MSGSEGALRRVVTALPGADDGHDREWAVLLSCGHEATLVGRRGLRPKKGAVAICRRCASPEATCTP